MEIISLLKLMALGVPETVLNLLIGLVLCRDNVKKNWKSFIFKMVVSSIVILTMIYFVRRTFNSFTMIAGIMTAIYILIFKIVWEMNFRQSILSGCSTMFFLICLETLTIPLYNKLIINFQYNNFLEGSVLFTPFLRLLHIIVFLIFTKWNLRNNELISGEWAKQNSYSKTAIVIIIISIFWCMLSMLNYMDFNYKLASFGEELSFLVGNVRLIFWMIIWFFIFLLVLLYYIFNFLDTQKMFDISIEEIFNLVGEELSKPEIKDCIEILQQKYNEKGGE